MTKKLFQFVAMIMTAVLFTKGNGAEVANSENDYMTGSLNRQVLV